MANDLTRRPASQGAASIFPALARIIAQNSAEKTSAAPAQMVWTATIASHSQCDGDANRLCRRTLKSDGRIAIDLLSQLHAIHFVDVYGSDRDLSDLSYSRPVVSIILVVDGPRKRELNLQIASVLQKLLSVMCCRTLPPHPVDIHRRQVEEHQLGLRTVKLLQRSAVSVARKVHTLLARS